jgi:HD-GYP domain-containing protein (c-di-GMP phosphodiesterase class II)/CHASE2 domain-containing sensor protein
MIPVHIKRAGFFLIILSGILIIFFLDYLGLFEGIDAYVYDISFRIRGSHKPSDKIIIAAIDEKSLEQLGRWPLKRIYYARLFDKMQQAAVVGLDIILTEPSDDDIILSEAIKRHGGVILPIYIDRRLTIAKPSETLSAYGTGHVHIEYDIDNVAREVFHTLYYKDVQLYSLTSVMYEIMTHRSFNRQKISAKTHEITSKRIFQMDPLKINYYGNPGTFQYISMFDIIDGKYPSTFFNGKAVLVGLTAPGIVDMVSTPFSQQRNKMPGVEVQANILNNLIDGNSIQDIKEWIRWISAIVFCAICLLSFIKLGEKKAALLLIFSSLIITALVFFLFTTFDLWTGPALFYFSAIYIYMVTYIMRLDEAAKNLDIKYSSVTSLLGGYSDQKGPAVGLVSFLSPGGINVKIQKLMWVEHKYEKQLEYTVQQKTKELSQALSMISNMSKEMIMRLTTAAESKDEHTGKHISRIGLYANRLAGKMEMPPDFIEKITLASAMHDIGKIGIPDDILLKPGQLTEEEFEIIKRHTIIGSKILSGSEYPMIQISSTIALCHHERWDGTGYPKGLKGQDIPIEARIIMICDVYDALRSPRPYKPAFDHQRTFQMITKGDVKTIPEHFDPDVLHAFIQIAPTFDDIFNEHSG